MEWRRTPRLAWLFIVVWMAIQVVVPLTGALVDDTPDRFRWQMFSTPIAPPVYEVVTPNGVVMVEAAAVTARLRADLPFDDFIPDHLCETIPDATEIRRGELEVGC